MFHTTFSCFVDVWVGEFIDIQKQHCNVINMCHMI